MEWILYGTSWKILYTAQVMNDYVTLYCCLEGHSFVHTKRPLSDEPFPEKTHVSYICEYNDITRSIQRTQTPPHLWPLTLSCDLDHKSRSNRLMSLDVLYCTLVSGKMSVSVIVCDIWPLVHFLWPLTFACDLHRLSRSLSTFYY